MALRSRSHTATATSGPGRAPSSDGRTRHRRAPARGRAHRQASAEELRRRAELLFGEPGECAGEREELGHGPPGGGGSGGEAVEPPVLPVAEARGQAASPVLPVPPVVRAAGLRSPAPVDAGPWTAREPEPRVVRVGSPVRVALEPDGFSYAGGAEVAGAAGEFSGTGEVDGRRDHAAGAWRERVGAALRERMPVWVQTRCGLERRNVVALGVLLVVAAVFAVQHFWVGRTQPVRAPEVVGAAAPYGDGNGVGSRGGAAGKGAEPRASSVGTRGASSAAGTEIVVDVGGKVREPGVHRLPAGSRVTDALRAAGGVRPGTNTDGLNRARFLVDGEQIVVGGPAPAAVPGAGGANTAGTVGSAAGAAAPTAPVSLNTATADQLNTLPGVGPVLAQHIIDYRTQHGGFRSVDELRQVNGIGDRRFADLRDLVQP
ncbi:helix-hairpin-helix domain-containing protein [Streptomyces sp. NPDC013161]|uniref:helix-hairpin-helix domain-containing protein n=1 Tax=Streptomyces sp. NPDC013161 TaxID=3364862 RepID=UPI0036BF06DA